MVNTAAANRGSTQSGSYLIVGGFATLVFLLVAYLAFDDITTDNATSFTLEYTFLLACAVWGQRKVGPGTVASWQLEYLATLAGMFWFLVLSAILVAMGFRYQRQAGGRGERHPS